MTPHQKNRARISKEHDKIIKDALLDLYDSDVDLVRRTIDLTEKWARASEKQMILKEIEKWCKKNHQRHTVDLPNDMWNFTKGYNNALDELLEKFKKSLGDGK